MSMLGKIRIPPNSSMLGRISKQDLAISNNLPFREASGLTPFNSQTYLNPDFVTGWTNTNVTVTQGVSDPQNSNGAVTLTGVVGTKEVYQALASSIAYRQFAWIRRRTGVGAIYTGYNGALVPWPDITPDWGLYLIEAPAGVGNNYFMVGFVTDGDAIDIFRPSWQLK